MKLRELVDMANVVLTQDWFREKVIARACQKCKDLKQMPNEQIWKDAEREQLLIELKSQTVQIKMTASGEVI